MINKWINTKNSQLDYQMQTKLPFQDKSKISFKFDKITLRLAVKVIVTGISQ